MPQRKHIANDALHYAMRNATHSFARSKENAINDRVFTLACLSEAINAITGHKDVIDGDLLRFLLTGRNDIALLPNGYYELLM